MYEKSEEVIPSPKQHALSHIQMKLHGLLISNGQLYAMADFIQKKNHWYPLNTELRMPSSQSGEKLKLRIY
jgi:hypothetical protein